MNDLLNLYWTFVKIGCVTFGGGYAMLPILERELADKRHWTTLEELQDYFAIGQCTPGIIALNVSTFIGEKRHGVRGALAATTGFLTGPILIILVIAMFLTNFAPSSLSCTPSPACSPSASPPPCWSFLPALPESPARDWTDTRESQVIPNEISPSSG